MQMQDQMKEPIIQPEIPTIDFDYARLPPGYNYPPTPVQDFQQTLNLDKGAEANYLQLDN